MSGQGSHARHADKMLVRRDHVFSTVPADRHGSTLPDVDDAIFTPAFDIAAKDGIARGEILGAMIEMKRLGAPPGRAAARRPSLVEEGDVETVIDEDARAGKAGDASADHADFRRLR